jgi:hypothetical protein
VNLMLLEVRSAAPQRRLNPVGYTQCRYCLGFSIVQCDSHSTRWNIALIILLFKTSVIINTTGDIFVYFGERILGKYCEVYTHC